MTKYSEPQANEWVIPIRKAYKLACCDCGLVHEIDFRVVKRRIQFRVRRNNRSTAMMRRHKGWHLRPDGVWVESENRTQLETGIRLESMERDICLPDDDEEGNDE